MVFSNLQPISREQFQVFCNADYKPVVLYSTQEKKFAVALQDSEGDVMFSLSFVQRQGAARERETKTHSSFPVSTLGALGIRESYFKILD